MWLYVTLLETIPLFVRIKYRIFIETMHRLQFILLCLITEPTSVQYQISGFHGSEDSSCSLQGFDTM